MESDKESSKSLLEWELSLNFSDLRSHAWYHGNISRLKAESLLTEEGSFLVRDCSSRIGDYALSCRWNGGHLHFIINKVVIQPNTIYERVQYTFEDDYFDTVADLVTYYVGNQCQISKSSGAIIFRPANRAKPLCNERAPSSSGSERSLDRIYGRYNKKWTKDPILPKDKNEADDEEDKSLLVDKCKFPAYWERAARKGSTIYTGFDIEQLQSNDSKDSNSSSRVSLDILYGGNRTDFNDDKSNKSDISDTESNFFTQISLPATDLVSTIDPLGFHTFLLHKDNGPLENFTRCKIESILLDTGPLILANHLTNVDLNFLNHISEPRDFGLGLRSGLELILLPHGTQYRLDLLDRHKCLQYFVCHSILSASDNKARVAILNKWICVALELKTALGNLFSFTGVMAALMSPWIIGLAGIWETLRKNYTESALIFDTGLRPIMIRLEESTEPQAPNTTFPNIILPCQIFVRHEKLMEELMASVGQQHDHKQLGTDSGEARPELLSGENEIFKLDMPFENTADYGFQILSSHLEYCRNLVENVNLFKRNGEIGLDSCIFEELLLDMFKTEFYRLYLWGNKGCNGSISERDEAIHEVLDRLHCECT